MKDILIIKPFNLTFCALLALFLGGTILLIKKRKNNTPDENRKLLMKMYIGLFVIFCIYKLLLPWDKGYMEIYPQVWGEFTYWNELPPLNPCILTMTLTIFAMWKDIKPLKVFCFYTATFAPLLALVMPLPSFHDETLLSIHNLGYYIVHFGILMLPVLFVGLRVYQPGNKDSLVYAVTFVAVTAVVFGLDMLMRVTGVNPRANFFYCIENDENPILIFLQNLIPIPFVYLLPMVAVLIPECLLVNVITNFIQGLGKKKKAQTN